MVFRLFCCKEFFHSLKESWILAVKLSDFINLMHWIVENMKQKIF
jgi:hypothetical protein